MGGAASLDSNALNNIRLIDFEKFEQLGTFPRYPENKDIVIPIKDFSPSMHTDSLIVFVSHCWLRGWPGAEGWDGRAHPDNAEGSKFKLCVDGIKYVKNSMAPGMKHCYIWLDFGCIDQNGNPAGELKMLDKIVQISDIIFTPLYEPHPESWKLPPFITNAYEDYKSPSWIGTPHSYLNRGWCRVEMFYAANVPLFNNSPERLAKFDSGLAFHSKDGRRPHILYGSYDQRLLRNPFIMPPLQNSWFENYHPAKGFLTVERDRAVIDRLVEDLIPYMKTVKVGYEGEYNDNGEKEGKGVWRYENGDIYDGEWLAGVKSGQGTYTYSDGDVYDGGWLHGKRHGKGKFTYLTGNFFDGDWIAGKKQGKGYYIFGNGDIYEGDWENDNMHGMGKYTYTCGDIFEGAYVDDEKCGYGVYTFVSDGTTMKGQWENGECVKPE